MSRGGATRYWTTATPRATETAAITTHLSRFMAFDTLLAGWTRSR
jgi:hypothetical protein